MGLILAVKRSYRYFIPKSLLTPRKFVRDHYGAIFFYFVGVMTGLYWYGGSEHFQHISTTTGVGLVVLLILRWWAGAGKPADCR